MKPILFNTDMVRAILGGRKTVTRRVVKPQPQYDVEKAKSAFDDIFDIVVATNPPYQPGDILYVRETCQKVQTGTGPWRWVYRADMEDQRYFDDGFFATWRPSIHMPREAARIFLRVTDVRVERLPDITEEKARKEGIDIRLPQWAKKKVYSYGLCRHIEKPYTNNVECFKELWDSTIKPKDRDKYGWAANPWVWVISFERISKEEAGT